MKSILPLAALAVLVFTLLVQCPRAQQLPPDAKPLIVLIGPPLSGKSTYVEFLAKTYGMPAISVEDLIADHASELDKLRPQGTTMAEMRYDPAISRYFLAKARQTDLQHGLVVDGYPATVLQGQDLAKMLPDLQLLPLVIQLDVPDDVVRDRAKKTGRESDRPAIVEQRLKDYHREFDFASAFFPRAKIVQINGNQAEPKVWAAMQKALEENGIQPARQ